MPISKAASSNLWGVCLRTTSSYTFIPSAMRRPARLLSVQNLKVAPNLQNLYDHLVENHFIEELEGYNPEYLSIFSRAVLKMIQGGEAGWEKMVPQVVADMIKNGRLYGYQPSQAER